MEDYIFLLLAVALSIFGAINKKKKQNSDNPFTEKTEKPRNFFMDQLLGEDLLEEEVVVKPKVKAFVKKEVVPSVPQVSSFANYRSGFKSSLPSRPQKSVSSQTKKSEPEPENLEQEYEEGTSYLEDFSLRKAFVYSEIMNRKY